MFPSGLHRIICGDFKLESGAKAHPARVRASYSKAQPVRPRLEAPHQNPGFRQPFEPELRVRRAARAGTADCRQPGRNRPPPIFCRARLRRRANVPASCASHCASVKAVTPMAMAAPETGQGPSAARSFSATGFGAIANPRRSPGRAIGLAEGAQYDNAGTGDVRDDAGAGLKKIDKCFVDYQQAAVFAENRRQRVQIRRRDEPSIRIVGIDDDGDIFVFEPREVFDDGQVLRRWRPSCARARNR